MLYQHNNITNIIMNIFRLWIIFLCQQNLKIAFLVTIEVRDHIIVKTIYKQDYFENYKLNVKYAAVKNCFGHAPAISQEKNPSICYSRVIL